MGTKNVLYLVGEADNIASKEERVEVGSGVFQINIGLRAVFDSVSINKRERKFRTKLGSKRTY